MTIDKHGNNHHGAGTPDGGRFATKTNTAPAGSLSEDSQVDIAVREHERAVAEFLLSESRVQDAELGVLFARARQQAPAARTIVVYWDDEVDQPYVEALLADDGGEVDAGGDGLIHQKIESFTDWQDMKTRFLRDGKERFLIPIPAADSNTTPFEPRGPRATPEQIAAIQARVDETWSSEATLYEPVDGHPEEGYVDIIAFDGGEGSAKKYTIDPYGAITDYDIDKDRNL
ncbi:hypothetical protein [Microbacterium gorillae]|uniref:hypothetical protein n=1 Tax=Microbacterium gorillae TaxID=1231063 RepID=UPI003D958C9E